MGFYAARRATTNVYSGGTITTQGNPSGGDFAFKLFVPSVSPFEDGFESGTVSAWL